MTQQTTVCVHATTIAWEGQGVLILGASGSGKSTLALHLMALGCDLVADDQTQLSCENQQLIARCPDAIKGKVEARGFGILNANSVQEAQIICAVDLDLTEAQRLPDLKTIDFCGQNIRLFHKPGIEVLPFALLQYLKITPAQNEKVKSSAHD